GVAREGERRRRADRQVERPARAGRSVRPRDRDVARRDRRRDRRKRARRAAHRRGNRRRPGREGAGMRFRGWIPLVLLAALIVAVSAYTAVRQDAFLTEYNLSNLLLATMPLALVAIGQTNALLVGGFDVSVAALITMCVVTASFTLKPDETTFSLFLGALAIVGVGLATGIFNATLIRVLRLPSIIATLGTLSILEGASLLLRASPQGEINSNVIDALNTSIGFMPVAFIGVVLFVVLADVWLYRTRTGMAVRAVGLDETSARRLGMSTGLVIFLAFVVCSVMASIAGFYSAAPV